MLAGICAPLALVGSVAECEALWNAEMAKDTSSVRKAANGEFLLGRFDGIAGETGWSQEMGATRRQKCELTGDEELKEFESVSDQMLSTLNYSL